MVERRSSFISKVKVMFEVALLSISSLGDIELITSWLRIC